MNLQASAERWAIGPLKVVTERILVGDQSFDFTNSALANPSCIRRLLAKMGKNDVVALRGQGPKFELAIPIVGIPALHDRPEDESLLSVTISGCSGEFSVRKDQQDDLLLLADNSKPGQRDYVAIVRRANSCQIDQCAKVVGRPCPLDEPGPIQQVNATPIPWTVAEEMFKLL